MNIDPTNLHFCCIKRLERASESTTVVCVCGNIMTMTEGRWRWAGMDILETGYRGETE